MLRIKHNRILVLALGVGSALLIIELITYVFGKVYRTVDYWIIAFLFWSIIENISLYLSGSKGYAIGYVWIDTEGSRVKASGVFWFNVFIAVVAIVILVK